LIISQQAFVYTCWSGLLIHSWLIEPSGFRSFFSLYMTSHVYIIFNLNLRYDSFFLSFMLRGGKFFVRDIYASPFSQWEFGGVAWLFLQYTFSGCFLLLLLLFAALWV
jgi:hypothetical protein